MNFFQIHLLVRPLNHLIHHIWSITKEINQLFSLKINLCSCMDNILAYQNNLNLLLDKF